MEKRIPAAARAHNELFSLAEKPADAPGAEPVWLDSEEGEKLIARTFAFALCKALEEALPGRFLLIGQPVENCPYWMFSDGVTPTEADLDALSRALRALAGRDAPITVSSMPAEEAAAYFQARQRPELLRHIQNRGAAELKVCVCDGFIDIYREPLLDKTGKLPGFSLKRYHKGFVLVPESAGAGPAAFDAPASNVFEARARYDDWSRICGAHSAAAVNELTGGADGAACDFVRLTEMYADGNIAACARGVYERRKEVRVILLAGPSSSGKTTTAKRLGLHLRLLGLKPVILSLDDYYLPPALVPKDADGKPDFECPEALDIPFLNAQLLGLLDGETVMTPKFDFKTGTRQAGAPLRLERRSILMLEGIHALNDALTEKTPRHKKYKLYVSALTHIKLDEHHRVSSADNRLLRRIARDSRFRGMPAARTLAMWPGVRRGELKHIFPFQNEAAFVINSALEYEIGVLRLYAEPLLRTVPASCAAHAEAARLLRLLENFAVISPQHVPGVSVLREFIGGSEFKY